MRAVERVHASTKIIEGVEFYPLREDMKHIVQVRVNGKLIKKPFTRKLNGIPHLYIDREKYKDHTGTIDVFFDRY